MVNVIEIWAPKYSNNTVRVNVNKVKLGENYLTFTKAPSFDGAIFKFDGAKAKTCPIEPKGKGKVYEIPMDYLEEAGYVVE